MGEPIAVTKGQFWTEVILWLLFLLPGLVYSVWRLASRTDGCASCGSQSLIPVDSPLGEKIAAEYNAKYPVAQQPPLKPKPKAVAFGRKLGRLFAKRN